MPLLDYLPGPLRRRFSYDAVENNGRRKAVPEKLQSEDAELPESKRRRLVSNARDLQHNSTIGRWAVGKHLDYVSTFSFQAISEDEALAERVEGLIKEWSKKENCDIAGRHSLARIIRLGEARKTVDGDILLVKLAAGKVQAVEGDRIRTPSKVPDGYKASDFTHGVLTDTYGKATGFSVCRRGSSSNAFTFERVIAAGNSYHHAHFDRFDQVRGVSPMACALNDLRDLYEARVYALAKMKICQMFGVQFYRGSGSSTELPLEEETDDDFDETANPDTSTDQPKYRFESSGVNLLQMEEGDKAEILESKNPSMEFQAFDKIVTATALKSLDIPYSFYDESFTNYSGSRQALLQYDLSASIKRQGNQDLLNDLTEWRIRLWILEGVLPADTLERLTWLWVPRGMPWLQPVQEVTADIMAIDSVLDNPEDICQRRGTNVWQNIDKIARVKAYAEEKGVQIFTKALPQIIEQPEPANAK